MTHSGIEAIAAQRIRERQDEAARERLVKTASADAGGRHPWRIHLPGIAFRRQSPTTHVA